MKEVACLVSALLSELEPESAKEASHLELELTATKLFDEKKIFVYLAVEGDIPIGVITLHECAAIYAGGIFGEISEMYIKPDYRSSSVGKLLINKCIDKAREENWKRLEVGTPPSDAWPRTVKFYEKNEFEDTGTRLRLLVE